MQGRQALKNTIQEQQVIHVRIIMASLIVLGLLCSIVFRFYYLQIVEYEIYQTKSDSNRVHLSRVAPKRGLIFDNEQRLLAENTSSYVLAIIRDRVEDVAATLAQLKLLGIMTDDDIERYWKLENRYRAFESMPIRFSLTDEEIAKVEVNRVRLPGLEVKANLARHYPYSKLLAHAIGYVGRINEKELAGLDQDTYGATNYIGKLGIESSYEDILHGEVGYEYVETNARGEVLRTLERTDPIPGANIVLHLDLDLQLAAKKALNGKRGAVVALNARNGGVLVALSSPSFDPNLFVRGISYNEYNGLRDDLDLPLFNRFLQAQYPPGSTIKPIMSLAGLEERAITEKTTINDPGWYQLPNDKRLYRDWKRQGHGTQVGFVDALEQSCDVYYYDLANKLGIDKIHRYYAMFGFGKPTGIDLPGERPGLNPSQDWKRTDGRGAWFPGDSLNIGIGQGYLLTTPLQLAYATNVLANNGERLVPQMVAKVGAHVVDPVYLPSLEIKTPRYWKSVNHALQAVVHGSRGTGRSLLGNNLNYRIAGKSGTAQVIGIAQGEKYDAASLAEHKRDHALFIGFAPADNPEISVAVIVENGEHGGSVAGPVARAVMDAWMEKLARKKVEQ